MIHRTNSPSAREAYLRTATALVKRPRALIGCQRSVCAAGCIQRSANQPDIQQRPDRWEGQASHPVVAGCIAVFGAWVYRNLRTSSWRLRGSHRLKPAARASRSNDHVRSARQEGDAVPGMPLLPARSALKVSHRAANRARSEAQAPQITPSPGSGQARFAEIRRSWSLFRVHQAGNIGNLAIDRRSHLAEAIPTGMVHQPVNSAARSLLPHRASRPGQVLVTPAARRCSMARAVADQCNALRCGPPPGGWNAW